MDQDRRGFLKMLAMALPVAAAPKSYFFAPAGGWMGINMRPPDIEIIIRSRFVRVNPFGSLGGSVYKVGDRFEHGGLIYEVTLARPEHPPTPFISASR